MVGSAIWRNLESKGYTNLIGKSSKELDLRNQQAVADFFEQEKPEYVFLAAAKVGGIMANDTYRAEFIYNNIQIQNNIIHHSYISGVKKLLFLGSSCIYPRNCHQPMKEEYLLTGELEQTNEPYAIAKIAGIKMCENYNRQYGTNFISVMPTNLYGPNDNFNFETSHVLPAILRKMHLAKCLEKNDLKSIRRDLNKRPIDGIDGSANVKIILQVLKKYEISYVESTEDNEAVLSVNCQLPTIVTLWGSGNPKREFLYVDDMADACVHLMKNLDADELYASGVTHINIGSGSDQSIKELAIMVRKTVGFKGEIIFDTIKPDGTPHKLLDVSRLEEFAWKSKVELKTGLNKTYQWYLNMKVKTDG